MMFRFHFHLKFTMMFFLLFCGSFGWYHRVSYPDEFAYTLSNGNITDHVWSPDGQEIAYITCPDGQFWGCDLWITNWKLENSVKIYTGAAPYQLYDWKDDWILLGLAPEETPSLTSEGQAIAGELWKILDDGNNLTRITDTYNNGIRRVFGYYYQNIGTVGYAKFIPDTNLVYFSAHDGNGWWGAHTTTDDGTDQWLRIKPYSYSFTIGISPSGAKLLWGSSWYWDQPTSLWVSDTDGSNIQLIKNFSVKTSPLVLLDEETIILSWPDGSIHAIFMNGSSEWVVLSDGYSNYWADYSPVEEDAFLMTSNRAEDGNIHIYKIYADGTDIEQLSVGPYTDSSALYSHNGRFISYLRLPEDYVPISGQLSPYELVVLDLVLMNFDQLMDEIESLKVQDILNYKAYKKLNKDLEFAMGQYCRGLLGASIGQLNAFIHQVSQYIHRGVLTEVQGQALIDSAFSIIMLIH